MDKPVVIIGNGCAAVEACRGLRENGYRGDIDVFSAGGLPTYNPMLTSYYAAGKIDYSLLFPYGESNRIYQKYGVRHHPNTPVNRLDASAGIVTADGREQSFDRCLVATGASPVVPPFPGSRLPGVYTMRTVEDAVMVKRAMASFPTRALVVGASMVGIKMVELFWKAGLRVTLADLAPRIFPLAAHPDCSRVIAARLDEKGISQRYGAALERIEEENGALAAFFKDDPEPLRVDIVILAIGVRPNLSFVDRDEVSVQQGILVNESMRSSHERIYAAGDCAQGQNVQTGDRQIIGLWANARRQGYTAGSNIAGVPRRYDGDLLHNITHFMGMDFIGIGDVSEENESRTEQGDGWYKQIFYRDGQIVGANFLDLYEHAGVFKNALVKQSRGAMPVGRTGAGTSQTALEAYLLGQVLAFQ